jgi:nicotinate dehydrogenase subunit B
MNQMDLNLSRRSLLQSSGALVILFSVVDAGGVLAQAARAIPGGKPALDPTELDSWLAIAPDGAVTVYFGKIDGGQGTDVAIAQIVADELDVPVARVSVVMGDSALTCNQGGASGSNGVSLGGSALRNAAAEARRILVERAGAAWNVPADRLTVSDGVIRVNGDATKSMTYAALIGGKYLHEKIGWNNQYGNALALTGKAKPKAPADYKVVGTNAPRSDVRGKVYGTKPYVTDINLPGMLHGRMIRPANAGSTPVAVDETSIRAIPGARVVRKGDFLGVVAPREWDAIRASQMLKVTWSDPVDVFPEQAQLYEHIRKAPVTKRQVTSEKGNIDTAFAAAAQVIEAEYEWPFQSHASMGGGCGVADVRADGVTVWTGTQKPHYAGEGVARILGVPADKVRAIWVSGPGSYGRNDAGDALMDAAVLSQAVGRPVRVQYMRNEGTGWDPKAPPSVHRVRAAVDAAGKITAWEFTSKGPSRVDTDSNESQPKDTLAGQLLGMTGDRAVNFGAPDGAYEYDNTRVAWETIPTLLAKASPLRTTHMRDPVGPQIHFASESFMDEVAAALKLDPIELRLRHVKRARDVAAIRAAAEKAGWKSGPAGTRRGQRGDVLTGQGFSYATRGATIIALVADVEVNRATGRVWARRMTVAHDCGLVVNPATLKTVIEGNIVQGLSRVFHEEVQFDRRSVKSIDWVTYPILDITETPEAIDIVLLNHPEIAPSGAGEGSTRIVAAAVNNAIFEATGIRFRRAPLNPARIRGAFA